MGNRHTLEKAGAVAFALLLWQIAAMALDQHLLLVSPVQVLFRLGSLCLEPDFLKTVAFSLMRIAGGFCLAFLLGAGLGMLAGRCRYVELLLWPFMLTIKSVPVASYVILCLIWLSSAQLPVFISFLMVLPVLYNNVLQGYKTADPKLLEMARLYGVPFGRRLLYIHLPQIKPFLLSACGVGLGMAWKAGVAAEVIGITGGSIGEKLYESKVYYNMADLFCWTVVIILVSLAFEKAFLWLLRRGFGRLERL